MPKVVLIGSPQTQWCIDGKFVPGGTLIELSDTEIKKHKDVISEELKEKETLKKTEKKYTEKQIFAMTKEEQIEILKSLGIKEIPRLEKTRVKEILEAQK